LVPPDIKTQAEDLAKVFASFTCQLQVILVTVSFMSYDYAFSKFLINVKVTYKSNSFFHNTGYYLVFVNFTIVVAIVNGEDIVFAE